MLYIFSLKSWMLRYKYFKIVFTKIKLNKKSLFITLTLKHIERMRNSVEVFILGYLCNLNY